MVGCDQWTKPPPLSGAFAECEPADGTHRETFTLGGERVTVGITRVEG